MYAYCVQGLGLSEASAFKRIRAARAARIYPVIFDAVAEGRLHLSGIVLLAPYLRERGRDELLVAAEHKTKAQIEELLARTFPREDVPTRVTPVSAPSGELLTESLAPGPVNSLVPPAPEPVNSSVPVASGPVDAAASRPKVTPLAPQRFALQVTIDQETHDALRRAQELLSHQLPSGDVAEVIKRALTALVSQLEKRKFAATSTPRRAPKRTSANPRNIQ